MNLNSTAVATINAGHGLVSALLDELSDADREKLKQVMTTPGASVAITLRWVDGGRVEVRVGVVTDDAPAECILALSFDRDPDAKPVRLLS